MNNYPNGSYVTWKWGQGKAEGKVVASYNHLVSREIKGTTVTRSGSADDPAYLIQQKDSSEVIKLHSELTSLSSPK